MMGQWRGKDLDTGPPRGPGHYSEDGRWWWDDSQARWLRTTGQEDVLEIKAEDVGGTSLANAREHRVLAGELVRKQLSFPERAIVAALHAPEGDFRDWTEVRQWAAGIAGALGAGFSAQAGQGGDHTG